MARDFLKNRSRYGVELILDLLGKGKWIYMRGGKWYTYKAIAESPQMSEYDLCGLGSRLKFKRKTAEQAIADWNKKQNEPYEAFINRTIQEIMNDEKHTEFPSVSIDYHINGGL